MLPHAPPLPTHFPSSNILLWPSCALESPGLPHRQQARRSRRRCRRKPVLPSALCVHSTHSRKQSSPHDSVPPHASLHRCCRELHHPDTILCHDSKAAQPSSTTHSCPSSPKSSHPHSYTHHICTPDPLPSHTAPSRVVPQHLSTTALFPRLITSCTDVFIHVLAVPRIHDPFPP